MPWLDRRCLDNRNVVSSARAAGPSATRSRSIGPSRAPPPVSALSSSAASAMAPAARARRSSDSSSDRTRALARGSLISGGRRCAPLAYDELDDLWRRTLRGLDDRAEQRLPARPQRAELGERGEGDIDLEPVRQQEGAVGA